jgi:LCP family protein required for cell wall assembly
VGLYLVICLPIDRGIAFEEPEASRVEAQKSGHLALVPYYVLLLGSDAREGEEVSRSDTMILARIDVIANQITMISIPRDTMVQIEGYGTQKINAAYAFGGTAGAMRAVSDLLNVPIAEAAIVHFDGISGLVDALGGVTVDVPVDVYDPDYTGLVMSAGSYEMDGETALLFSRVRHGFALGDYQRQIDQQLVIKAIMDKALSLGPTKLPSVLGSMNGLLGTTMRCYSIVPLMLRLKIGGATVYQATVPSDTAMVDGVSYVIADDEALAEMMAVIDAGGDPSTLS